MASFTSTVAVDMTDILALTNGATQSPLLGVGFFATNNAVANYSMNAVGADVFVTLPPTPPSGTVTSIYGYAGASLFTPGIPPGTTLTFSGLSMSAADALGFMTATSQLVSLNYLATMFAGADTLTGSVFDDVLLGGAGADTIDGGSGIDTASYVTSLTGVIVSLLAGVGAGGDAAGDTLTSIEALAGSGFADALTGDANANTLDGDDGNDIIWGGGGADTLIGGGGVDTAVYKGSSAGVTVSLDTGTSLGGDADGDTLSGFENIVGSGFGDTLIGDGGDNRLSGLDGVDFLYGGAGADVLFGGADVDVLDGEAGDDVLRGEDGADQLYGHAGNDRLQGGAGIDRMEGGDGNDSYEVDNEDDLVVEVAGEGSDRVVSTAGFYTLGENIEVLILGVGAVLGTGNSGNNTIRGNADSNALSGAAGNDTLQGMAGDDNLIGGAGVDRLYGGAGADLFTFNGPSDGVDRICDWEDGDRFEIDVNAFGLSVASGLNVVNGTSASVLTEDSVFYNTATGRLYAYDADTDSLTQFVAFTASKPLSLDSGDFALIS